MTILSLGFYVIVFPAQFAKLLASILIIIGFFLVLYFKYFSAISNLNRESRVNIKNIKELQKILPYSILCILGAALGFSAGILPIMFNFGMDIYNEIFIFGLISILLSTIGAIFLRLVESSLLEKYKRGARNHDQPS